MEKEDTKKLLAVIVASFPNYKPENTQFTLNTWHEMLKDYDKGIVFMALKAYIATDTSGFAPSIGQVINQISKLQAKEELTEIQAWGLVSKALRNGYYHSEEEFDKLPPTVQKAVGSPQMLQNWAMSDAGSIETVVASNFMRTYNAVVKRQEMESKLPSDVLALIHKTAEQIGVKE